MIIFKLGIRSSKFRQVSHLETIHKDNSSASELIKDFLQETDSSFKGFAFQGSKNKEFSENIVRAIKSENLTPVTISALSLFSTFSSERDSANFARKTLVDDLTSNDALILTGLHLLDSVRRTWIYELMAHTPAKMVIVLNAIPS